MSLATDIKDYALEIGYHAVGITTADPFPQFRQALEERREDYAYRPPLAAMADPHEHLPPARSIVVAAYDYAREAFPQALVGKIGRIYQSRCYLSPPSQAAGARLHLMRQFLEKAGCELGPEPGTNPQLSERQSAARAGVGRFGRNTFIQVPGVGSFVMMQSIAVDVELEADAPANDSHCPADCRRCIEACPTGAIVDEYRMVPQRCIAFNTFTTQGGSSGVSEYIPWDIRPQMGAWIHGCDLCQEACPRNHRRLQSRLPENPYLNLKASQFDLLSLLSTDDEYYATVVRPLMYNYIRDISLFRRNAAVALGNQGDRKAVPALTAAMQDPAEVVRAHAAWALGQLGGQQARAALEQSLAQEAGARARAEIEEALLTL